MSKYHISHQGETVGPFELDEILTKVQASEFNLMDFIYDEGKSDWVMLMEFAPLAEKLKDFKPKAPPKPVAPAKPIEEQKEDEQLQATVEQVKMDNPTAPNPDHLVTEWYVLKGENRFGPFAFTDVLKMLQQKVVFEFDFAWHPGLSTWKRIADLEAFGSENINQLKTTLMPDIEDVFFRRRHRRVEYGATVLIHDNKQIWKGQGVEISAGGAGVVMENSVLQPGQILHLHFKPCDGVPPFNAVCEIVSKKYVDGVKDKNAPIRYGLKFTNINEQTQKVLNDYSKSGSSAA